MANEIVSIDGMFKNMMRSGFTDVHVLCEKIDNSIKKNNRKTKKSRAF
jgi:hypothetical protein